MPDEVLLNNISIINGYKVLQKGRGEILSKKYLRIVKLITHFEHTCSAGVPPRLTLVSTCLVISTT
jgi:hypothetical protein